MVAWQSVKSAQINLIEWRNGETSHQASCGYHAKEWHGVIFWLIDPVSIHINLSPILRQVDRCNAVTYECSTANGREMIYPPRWAPSERLTASEDRHSREKRGSYVMAKQDVCSVHHTTRMYKTRKNNSLHNKQRPSSKMKIGETAFLLKWIEKRWIKKAFSTFPLLWGKFYKIYWLLQTHKKVKIDDLVMGLSLVDSDSERGVRGNVLATIAAIFSRWRAVILGTPKQAQGGGQRVQKCVCVYVGVHVCVCVSQTGSFLTIYRRGLVLGSIQHVLECLKGEWDTESLVRSII